MKQLVGSAVNVSLTVSDTSATLEPSLEVVLVYSEATYVPSVLGVRNEQTLGCFRFVGSVEALRKLAKNLDEFADEAQIVASSYRLKTDNEAGI